MKWKRWQKDILLVWFTTNWGLIPFPFSALSFRAAASFLCFWALSGFTYINAQKGVYFKSIYVRFVWFWSQENELDARVRSYVHIQWFLWCTDAKSLEMKYDLIGFSAFSNISKNKNDIKRIVSTFLLPNSSKIL